MINSNEYQLIYKNLIFEYNLNILFEEINQIIDTTIITEDNILDIIKNISDKVVNFFNLSINAFKMGYNYVIEFCKAFFQITKIKDLLNLLGITDDLLNRLIQIVKSSLIVVPVANIGYNVVTKTYKDIHDHDVAILIDREAFNDQSKKLYSQQTFLEKCSTIFKSGIKNLVIELILNIPLIFKCILGYAVSSGFEQAVQDPAFLTNAMKESLKKSDKVNNEVGANLYYTQEQVMEKINDGFAQTDPSDESAPVYNMLLKHLTMTNTTAYNPETKSLENVYAKHMQMTDGGIDQNLHADPGSYMTSKKEITYFDNDSKTYKTEDLQQSETQFLRSVMNFARPDEFGELLCF